jgi:GT2 family glycosyltransferase
MKPMLSILIVNYQSSPVLAESLRSLQRCVVDGGSEIIIYDNGPEDQGLPEIAGRFLRARIITSQRFLSFSAANNRAAECSSGDLLFFLNPDTIVNQESLDVLATFARENPQCGAVGPRLVDRNGIRELSHGRDPGILSEALRSIQHKLPKLARSVLTNGNKEKQVDWITGAAMMTKRKAFESVGGFDEHFPLYFEDSDFCRRLRDKGWKICFLPEASIVHFKGESSGNYLSENSKKETRSLRYRQSQLRYYRKHHGWFQNGVLHIYLRAKLGKRLAELEVG